MHGVLLECMSLKVSDSLEPELQMGVSPVLGIELRSPRRTKNTPND